MVAHRRNTLAELAVTPRYLGVEVDVRPGPEGLVVAHDPHEAGVSWTSWLTGYQHRLLVVNTKAEGIIAEVLASLADQGIEDFFLLGPDPGEALPFWRAGESRIAVRVSEVHAPETALAVAGLATWVWLDGYDGFPVSAGVARTLDEAGMSLCLVSPELYGRPDETIPAYQHTAASTGVRFAAVCTRAWDAWQA